MSGRMDTTFARDRVISSNGTAGVVRILHVSDVHFGVHDDKGRMPKITQMLIKTAHEQPPPDLCVFSGDLAQSGSMEELQQGFRWLKELLGEWDYPPLAIVPGNHDLVRDATFGADVCRVSAVDGQFYQGKRELLAKQERFENFVKICDEESRQGTIPLLFDWTRSIFCAHGERRINGVDIHLIGINSAVAAVGKDAHGTDEGRLVVDLHSINDEWEKWNSEGKLVIAVAHHPFDWLADWNRQEVERDLKPTDGGAHLWLHGHLHETEMKAYADSNGLGFAPLYCGAAYQDTRWSRHFAFYEVDLRAREIRPTLYRHDLENKGLHKWFEDKAGAQPFVTTLPRLVERGSSGTAADLGRATPLDKTYGSESDFEDDEICDWVAKQFKDDNLKLLTKSLFAEVEKTPGDPCVLLCSRSAADAIRLVGRSVNAIADDPDLGDPGGLRERVRELVAWLALRAVDKEELKAVIDALRNVENARADLAFRDDLGAEVIMAYCEGRAPDYANEGTALRPSRHIDTRIALEGGIGKAHKEQKKKIHRQVFKGRSIPWRDDTTGDKAIDDMLRDTLFVEKRAWYTTADLIPEEAGKVRMLYDQLQGCLPRLKVIFTGVDDSRMDLKHGGNRLADAIALFFKQLDRLK